jgi:SAM-dependent methyltransferase
MISLIEYLKLLLIIIIVIIAAMQSRYSNRYAGGDLPASLIETYKKGRPVFSKNIAEIVAFLRECPFPYLGDTVDLEAAAKLLRDLPATPIVGEWELTRGTTAPAYIPRLVPIYFALPKVTSGNASLLTPTDYFTEDRRMAVSVAGLPSPIAFWNSDRGRETLARWLCGRRITRAVLHDALYQADWNKVRPATEFHAAHVVNIVKFFAGEMGLPLDQINFYDPCAGHGARLFAAGALGVNYLACDPDKDLIEPHAAIIKHFNARARVLPIPAETIDTQTLDEFKPNLVFTSPPYFNYERYALADTSGQSTESFSDYDVWVDRFLRVVFNEAARALQPKGFLCVHLSDVAGYPLAQDLLKVMAVSTSIEYLGAVGLRGEGGKTRPVWVWRRI